MANMNGREYTATFRNQLREARKLSDDDVRRHASVATDNGPFDPADDSFTTACEFIRRERGLPHLHAATLPAEG